MSVDAQSIGVAHPRVTVVGAGVAGLACAVELAERGADVEVIERSSTLASLACARHAGGMLSPWCELENAEPLVTALGAESIPWWSERFAGTVRHGSLIVAHDNADLVTFARRTQRFAWVEGDQLAALEPDLAGRFPRALFFEAEAHLDPHAALHSLTARLTALGGRIRFGVSDERRRISPRQTCSEVLHAADGHQRNGGFAPSREPLIVDCRGLAARDVLTDLRGVRGERILLRSKDIHLTRPVRLLNPRWPIYIVPRGDGLFMVGATMIESDDAGNITARSMLDLLSGVHLLHPAFSEAQIIETGVGIRPAFLDNLPRVRWRDGVLYVNGLHRHGFLLAPALARIAADALLHDRFTAEVMDENPRERRIA
jgi:glycine oxidase